MKKVFLSLAVVAVLTVVSCKKTEAPVVEEVVADSTVVATDSTVVATDSTVVATDSTVAPAAAPAK